MEGVDADFGIEACRIRRTLWQQAIRALKSIESVPHALPETTGKSDYKPINAKAYIPSTHSSYSDPSKFYRFRTLLCMDSFTYNPLPSNGERRLSASFDSGWQALPKPSNVGLSLSRSQRLCHSCHYLTAGEIQILKRRYHAMAQRSVIKSQ
jgi:hypothetical protein